MMNNLVSNHHGINKVQLDLCAIQGWHLTKREAQILSLLLCQLPIAFIAKTLCRQENTINKHLENIKRKTNCSTSFGLGIKVAHHLSQLQENSRK